MLAISHCAASAVCAAQAPPPSATPATQTAAVAALIAQGLTARTPEAVDAAEQTLRAVMDKSPEHATFVARKLMLFDLTLGTELRRRLLLWPIMDAHICNLWLPLREPGTDDARVAQRATHIVNVVCTWLDSPGALAHHLALAAQPGAVSALSWVWGELAACLLECEVPLDLLALDADDVGARHRALADMEAADVLSRHPLLASRLQFGAAAVTTPV